MIKARKTEGGGLAFWCPACDGAHIIGIAPPRKIIWQWNGSLESPTISPSIKVEGGSHYGDGEPVKPEHLFCCHSFIREGRIEFCGDCTHALAGKTVDLPEWPKPDYGGLEPLQI